MFEAELSTSYEYTSEEEEDKEVLRKKAGKGYDNSPDAKAKSLACLGRGGTEEGATGDISRLENL